jgi:hypothetical protein
VKKTFNQATLVFVLALLGMAACLPNLGFKAKATNQQPEPLNVSASVQYLARVMDQYHDRFPVYDDVSSAGNHFHGLTKFPTGNALVTINGSYSLEKHSGATAIRCTFTPGGANFGGFNFQNGVLLNGATAPVPNFGTEPNAGYDLTGATTLTFWARGAQGGETVDFFMGGVGWSGEMLNNPCTSNFPGQCPFPDSTSAVKITVTLTTQWTQYAIDLAGKNLNYVLGGFAWGVNGALNPGGAVFYLDDIQYNLNPTKQTQRLNEPRFLRSFTTLPLQPDVHDANLDDDIDLVLRNTAFVYDNALAVLAFLADGSPDSLRRAKLIGDAIVYTTAHDRSFNDGRLRSAYAAGDIALPPGWTPNNRVGTVPIAGFYEDLQMQFFELGEARVFDTGNQAWAMVALLALQRRTGDTRYLNAARLLGNLIHSFRNNTGTYQGFLGGLDYANGDNASPAVRPYASTEHNLDTCAAFTVMFNLTGETIWQADAQHAKQLVEAMWDSSGGCYFTGTIDPNQRNTNFAQLPLDVQPWSVLALPDTFTLHPQVLTCAEINHRTVSDGFTGFDFNTDKDGVWFEGTGHMATAYARTNQLATADFYRQELNRAQATPPFGDGFGISAASHDGVSTGFGFKLFRRLHVGATAWHVFAQLGFNPYYQLQNRNRTIGLYRPSGSIFYLRNSNTTGFPDLSVPYGAAGDIPLVGDWDGNGTSTIGLYRPSTSTFYLRNSNSIGFPDITVSFGDGPGGDLPIVGDWDGDGTWTIGVYRPSTSTFYLKNSNTLGFPDISIPYGAAGDLPVVGDWDGNGTTTIGLYRPGGSIFYLRNNNTVGFPDLTIAYGAMGDLPIVGDWDGNGTVTIGLYRPSGSVFYLRNSNTTGFPDLTIAYGAAGDKPLAGDWDGL